MDNAQVSASDASWFLFADWQGVTRLASPGDKVKTNRNLDRPNEDKPLVVRPNGNVWLEYACDVEPSTVKKVRPDDADAKSPDPLGGPDLDIEYDGASMTLGDTELVFEPTGEPVRLGGASGRQRVSVPVTYQLYADGSLVVIGEKGDRPIVTFVTRDADRAGKVGWSRFIELGPYGSPDAYRHHDAIALVDRDPESDVAFMVVVQSDGTASECVQTTAVAGPWLHEDRIWWQPDRATVCVGDALGEAQEQFELSGEEVGPGRLLRVPGRAIVLPWHGVSIIDLKPAKKGKREISRKHKKTDEPLYMRAAKLLQPIREGMAKRGIDVAWIGVTRSGGRIVPKVAIRGTSSLMTFLLGLAVQDGGKPVLADAGVDWIDLSGGSTFDPIFEPHAPTSVADVHEMVAMLDAAGINRGCAFARVASLMRYALQRGEEAMPWSSDAELVAAAALLSGLLGQSAGDLPDVTADALAAAAPLLVDHQAIAKTGISAPDAAVFLAVVAHRRFGEQAKAPLMATLEVMNPTYLDEVNNLVGAPIATRGAGA